MFDSLRGISAQARDIKRGVDVSATTPQACRILGRGFFPNVGRRCQCQTLLRGSILQPRPPKVSMRILELGGRKVVRGFKPPNQASEGFDGAWRNRRPPRLKPPNQASEGLDEDFGNRRPQGCFGVQASSKGLRRFPWRLRRFEASEAQTSNPGLRRFR